MRGIESRTSSMILLNSVMASALHPQRFGS
jgi:hypothetical protein